MGLRPAPYFQPFVCVSACHAGSFRGNSFYRSLPPNGRNLAPAGSLANDHHHHSDQRRLGPSSSIGLPATVGCYVAICYAHGWSTALSPWRSLVVATTVTAFAALLSSGCSAKSIPDSALSLAIDQGPTLPRHATGVAVWRQQQHHCGTLPACRSVQHDSSSSRQRRFTRSTPHRQRGVYAVEGESTTAATRSKCCLLPERRRVVCQRLDRLSHYHKACSMTISARSITAERW